MTKILLICSAGMSTSFMVEKMKKASKDKNIETDILAIPDAKASEYVGKVDIVLLGPQVKYLLSSMKELFKDTPVTVIDMMNYGTMNGEKVLEDALKLLKGE
ncbi:PTS sugar transporter subunit IIB [Sneathia vaginalis]|uniref:PTS sugar transporter subunit IIB n=1 Tax=Sneathia vaginalis TaxID=187101 RepID=UPI00372D6865